MTGLVKTDLFVTISILRNTNLQEIRFSYVQLWSIMTYRVSRKPSVKARPDLFTTLIVTTLIVTVSG